MSRLAQDDGASPKSRLYAWVDGQRSLDVRTKYLLEKLAMYADAEGVAWAKVDTLAGHINGSERTAQNHLRKLESLGLIKNTGRTHRLKGSTRSVPLYQLAPHVEGLGAPISMGANSAPIETHGCNPEGGMGAKGLHPYKEDLEPREANASSAGAREALFSELEGAVDRRVLRVTDRDEAWLAFCALGDAGVDLSRLADCARRQAADPDFKTRRFPPALETWLAKGQWRGWLPEPDAPPTAAPAAEADGLAGEGLPAEVLDGLTAAAAKGYLRRVTWRAEDRTILAGQATADRLRREYAADLRALGVQVEGPIDRQTLALQSQEAR